MPKKGGPGEKSVMSSYAPPSAKGTEGYATGLLGSSAQEVEESGLKGGSGSLPAVGGTAGTSPSEKQSVAEGGVNAVKGEY